MKNLRCRLEFPFDTNLPEDVAVWHLTLRTIDPLTDFSAADLDAIPDLIGTMLSEDPVGDANPMEAYLSPVLNGQCVVSLYNIDGHLDGSDFGSPVRVEVEAFTPGASPLPSEMAIKVRLEAVGRAQAAVESGVTRPKQRFTGGFYVGPLSTSAFSAIGGVARVSVAAMNDLGGAVVRLNELLATVLDTPAAIGVWSVEDAVVRLAQYAFVDNALDVQIRRGEAASNASRFTILQ